MGISFILRSRREGSYKPQRIVGTQPPITFILSYALSNLVHLTNSVYN